MKIDVEWSLCDGNGVCAVEAPEYFELDDEDELHVLREEVAPEDAETVGNAVEGCPKHALRLTD